LPILLADIFGSPNIGVYSFCNEKLLILPSGIPQRKVQRFRDALGVQACVTSIGGSSLLGIFVTANSNGIILPHVASEYEIARMRSATDVRIEVLEEKWTAFGNLILANDNGAIVHPDLPPSLRRAVRDVLEVEVAPGRIGGLPYVGSLAVATNAGVIANPAILESEKATIKDVLRVEVQPSTINGGVPFVKSGLLANTRGAVAGPLTRGPELMELTRTLGIV
jgi:translation initiation factor 6